MRGNRLLTVWTVRRKSAAKKTQQLGLRLTPAEKRAIETLAIELGYDVVEFILLATVAVYEQLGKGYTRTCAAITRDERIWDEIAKKAGQRADAEAKAIRKDDHADRMPDPPTE